MEDLKELSSVEGTDFLETFLLDLDDNRALPATSTFDNASKKEDPDDDEDEDEDDEQRYIRHFQDRINSSKQKDTSVTAVTPARSNSNGYPGNIHNIRNPSSVSQHDNVLGTAATPAKSNSPEEYRYIRHFEDKSIASRAENVSNDTAAPFESNGIRPLNGPHGFGRLIGQNASTDFKDGFDDGFRLGVYGPRWVASVWSRSADDVLQAGQEDRDDSKFDPYYDVSEYAASTDTDTVPVINGHDGATLPQGNSASDFAGGIDTGEEDSVAQRLRSLHQHDAERDRLINVSLCQPLMASHTI